MKKNKRKRIIILGFAALTVITLLVACIVIWNIKITDISVIGNKIYSDEEIISYIFPTDKDKHTVYAMWKKKKDEAVTIPFIKSYEVNITGLHSAEIVVYEKGIIGALKYMGTYLYFDSDGVIVDTSTMRLDGVVAIEGFNFDYFVLNDKLPVADNSIFGSILVLSNVIKAEELHVDDVFIDTNMNITVYVGDIKAYLGEGTYIEKKIHALKDVLPSISHMKGTLYLNYSADLLNTKEYFFKEDKEDAPAEDETTIDPLLETESVPEEPVK